MEELLEKCGITQETPVFTPITNGLNIGVTLNNILTNSDKPFYCMSQFYLLFEYMMEDTPKKSTSFEIDNSLKYLRNVIQYISQKYSEPIRIGEIAKHCGLDRSYLSKLFKNATDMTPQEYLLSFRMNKAKELLKDSSISVQNVAYSVGYNDPFSFSKFFKRETGLSPSEYRKKNL